MTPRTLYATLAAIGTLAVAAPAWVVSHPPAIPPPRPLSAKVPRAVRVVPPAELPPVEPVRFADLSTDEAQTYNAGIPFVTGPNPAARPFRFAGSADELERARDCLAAALIYEAGDDATGERAVAQVILNRLRHPAFPKTVCGVVFEGQERATGCQFTFTCDGALTRWQPSEAGWRRARAIAARALTGAVYGPVGYATHYHTDWVVPYWQASLDKLAKVGTHLFFRWTGWWGTPPAFNRGRAGAEPAVGKLASLSDAHRLGSAMEDAEAALANATVMALPPAEPVPGAAAGEADTFLVQLPRELDPDQFPALAARTCGARSYCKLMAWTPLAGVPAALPVTPRQMATMGFSYLRDRSRSYDKPLWNCQQFKRAIPAQCMKVQLVFEGTPVTTATPAAGEGSRGPLELDGVRRRVTPAPLPTPSPAAGAPAQAGTAP